MVVAWVLLDFLLTTMIAVFVSWFFTSRYLARRSSEHLAKEDVATLRESVFLLQRIRDRNDLVPLGFPNEMMDSIQNCINSYRKTKELPI
jgi:hypothetical protein